jgi:hypothetical protein
VRVEGDPDGCASLARELGRAASHVAEAGDYTGGTLPAALWHGAAADRWEQLSCRRSVQVAQAADQLSAAARVLADFAERLLDLQTRAARLATTAAEEGLRMDPAGGIPPVDVPYGPVVEPAAAAAQQRAQQRADVRQRLLAEVAALQVEEDEAHLRLSRTLTGIVAAGSAERHPREPAQAAPAPADQPSRWAVGTSDWPVVLGLIPTSRLSEHPVRVLTPGSAALAVARTTPAVAVVAGSLGVPGDLETGYSVEGAVAKQTVVGTASTVAGVAAAGAVTTAGVAGGGALTVAGVVVAPAVATVVVGITVTAGVGYVGSRLWDAAFGPGPATPPPKARRRFRTPTGAARPSGPADLPEPQCAPWGVRPHVS